MADPLTALIASGLSSIGISGVAGEILASLLGSAILSAASRALQGKTKTTGADTALELQRPTSQPPYRFVYGKTRAMGTPTGLHVKGNVLYGCWILNSRPSEGPFDLLLDKRPVTVTGDPYDFAGAGAAATNDPFAGYVRMWIGKGNQTSAPALIVSEAPEFYASTDAWRGLTVLWLRLDCGDAASRGQRWTSAPPEVAMDGKWSRVWDPRDGAQDQADPTTWTWSANQALAVLDALLANPVTPYDLRQIDLGSITWAADVADEEVSLAGADVFDATVFDHVLFDADLYQRRYEVHGTIVFAEGGELEDQLQPLLDAGASQWVRARGQLGLVPATVQDSALTLSDLLDDEAPTFVRYRSRDELYTEVSASYLAPDRAYEATEAPVYVVPGAQAADGGIARRMQPDLSMITRHQQAQRVQKIMVMRARAQRTITATFPPKAFQVVAGSWITLDLPAPFSGWSGLYQVENLRAAIGGTEQDGGVHLRCSLSLREVSAAIYAWDHTTEEQAVVAYTHDGELPATGTPGPITLTTVAVADNTQIKFAFDPSPSASVTSYEWQWRVDAGPWSAGGLIEASIRDTASKVFGYLNAPANGGSYEVRIRAVGSAASDWVSSAPVVTPLGRKRYLLDYGSPVTQASVDAMIADVGYVYLGPTRHVISANTEVNAFLYAEEPGAHFWINSGVTLYQRQHFMAPEQGVFLGPGTILLEPISGTTGEDAREAHIAHFGVFPSFADPGDQAPLVQRAVNAFGNSREGVLRQAIGNYWLKSQVIGKRAVIMQGAGLRNTVWKIDGDGFIPFVSGNILFRIYDCNFETNGSVMRTSPFVHFLHDECELINVRAGNANISFVIEANDCNVFNAIAIFGSDPGAGSSVVNIRKGEGTRVNICEIDTSANFGPTKMVDVGGNGTGAISNTRIAGVSHHTPGGCIAISAISGNITTTDIDEVQNGVFTSASPEGISVRASGSYSVREFTIDGVMLGGMTTTGLVFENTGSGEIKGGYVDKTRVAGSAGTGIAFINSGTGTITDINLGAGVDVSARVSAPIAVTGAGIQYRTTVMSDDPVGGWNGSAGTIASTGSVDDGNRNSGLWRVTTAGAGGAFPPAIAPTDGALLLQERYSNGYATEIMRAALANAGGTWARRVIGGTYGQWTDPSDAPSFGAVTFVGAGAGSAVVRYQGGLRMEITLPPDTAAQIALSSAIFSCLLSITGNNVASVAGQVKMRTGSFPFEGVVSGGAPLATMSADLLGTTGTAGNCTVSARVGAIHIENRELSGGVGVTRTYTLRL